MHSYLHQTPTGLKVLSNEVRRPTRKECGEYDVYKGELDHWLSSCVEAEIEEGEKGKFMKYVNDRDRFIILQAHLKEPFYLGENVAELSQKHDDMCEILTPLECSCPVYATLIQPEKPAQERQYSNLQNRIKELGNEQAYPQIEIAQEEGETQEEINAWSDIYTEAHIHGNWKLFYVKLKDRFTIQRKAGG